MTEHPPQKTQGDRPTAYEGPFEWLRDRLYDFVYTEGDFALQLVGDLIAGPNRGREQSHLTRQIDRREAKHARGNPKPKTKTAKPEIPFTRSEKSDFAEILRRVPGEGQIEYWKRKKWLLSLPSERVRAMIIQKAQIDAQIAEREASGITADPASISQGYQARMVKRQQKAASKDAVKRRGSHQ